MTDVKSVSSYMRPKVSYQDKVQDKENMLRLLEDYERVDSIDEVALKTHVRYVTLKEGRQVFRIGGYLRVIKPDYVVLYSDGKHWSVQRYHYEDTTSSMVNLTESESINEPVFETVFWRKVSISELDDVIEELVKRGEEQENKISEQENIINDQKKKINEKDEMIRVLKYNLNKLYNRKI